MQYNVTYRKKDNGIQVIISYKDTEGKWKQKSKQGFKSRGLAQIAVDKMVEDLKDEIKSIETLNPEYKDITFKEFSKMYLDHIKIHKEYNTYKNARTSVNQFSELNILEMSEIKNIDVQKCVDKLVLRKLKTSTIQLYVKDLKLLFAAAMDEYSVIEKTPIKKIQIINDKAPSGKKALTISELYNLLDNYKTSSYYITILLAGTCGMRIGEIVGLTWDCIDLENRIIAVNKQWKINNEGKYDFGDLKGTNSYREIPISLYTKSYLEEYKNSHKAGTKNRVIANSSTETIVTNFNKDLKKRGYNLTIHELRHTYATSLISNGIDFKTTAKLLGHDIKQTMNTYSHVTDDMFKNAAIKIDSIFK